MGVLRAVYYRAFEPYVVFSRDSQRDTRHALRAARIGMFAEWYLALSYFTACCAASVTFALAAASLLALSPEPAWIGPVLTGGVSILALLSVRAGFLLYPRFVAAARAKRIDTEFPSVVVLCYALARGGMSTVEIFRVVAQEKKVYGEISTEFGVVIRDIEWFGHDLNSALADASGSTPSGTLKGFFDGLVTILNSGADPKDYFKRQADTQLQNAELHLERELDQASLLAEVYVSGLLVLPLLLVVILSVLSALGSGGEDFVPLIVFGLTPLGTVAYLLMVEMMVPPEPLAVPKADPDALRDFGMASARADEAMIPPAAGKLRMEELMKEELAHARTPEEAGRLKRRFLLEYARGKARETKDKFVADYVAAPVDVIEVSGLAAIMVVAVGGFFLWKHRPEEYVFSIAAAGIVLFAVVVAVLPIGIFHEIRLSRARQIETALPDTLSKLSGFNERGIGLLQAFSILGRSSSGPLSRELRSVNRDVDWNGRLGAAIGRMRGRVNTLRMTKLGVLFERASAATGNLKEVLDIAAADATRTENLKGRKRQAMMSYVVVIYVVFAVFLYILYLIATLFYGEGGGFASVSQGASLGGSDGLEPAAARLLFFEASLIQGICCGLVAGRLGEGYLLSGMKHAAILSTIAWITFQFGVL